MTPLEIVEQIQLAERSAAILIMEAHNIIAQNKTDARNVVTQYDKAVQNELVNYFTELFPNAHFFCEEMEKPESPKENDVFIIDPIDGTMNFVHGFNHSCISVAYMTEGEVKAAAVFNPYSDEMFSAVKGYGAFLNGERIQVDDCGLASSVCCVGTSPYRTDLQDDSFDIIRKIFDASLDIRREGSAALDLCTVAAGRAGLYFELNLAFWDFAAGQLIAEEAGATVLTADGKEMPLDGSKTSIVAGGEKAVKEYFEL